MPPFLPSSYSVHYNSYQCYTNICSKEAHLPAPTNPSHHPLSYTLHPFFSQRELFQNTSTRTLTFLPAEGSHSKPLPVLLESSLAAALAGGRRLRPHLAQVLLQLNLSPNLTHRPPAALPYQPHQTSQTQSPFPLAFSLSSTTLFHMTSSSRALLLKGPFLLRPLPHSGPTGLPHSSFSALVKLCVLHWPFHKCRSRYSQERGPTSTSCTEMPPGPSTGPDTQQVLRTHRLHGRRPSQGLLSPRLP